MGDIVFYSLYERQYARLYSKPFNPDTAGQKIVRRAFGDAVRSWQALSPEEQYRYNKKARRLPMTGYNLYISDYMKSILHSGIKRESTLFISPVKYFKEGDTSVATPYLYGDGLCSPSIRAVYSSDT